jgi:hypothetical protein
MSDNYANPLQGAETDTQKAAKSIAGLLNGEKPLAKEETKEETKLQDSSEQENKESSQEEQPEVQEISEETESQEEEVSEEQEEATQEEEQIETQEKQDSTYKVKVAGQEFEVTLDELRNGYSRDADYRRKTEELSNERKSFQSEADKQRQDYSLKINELNQLMSEAQSQLNQDMNNINLEELYEEDPTEAARVEHRMRRKQEKLSQARKKVQFEQQKQFEGFLQEQQNQLVTKMPEFADSSKASNLKNNMRSYLQDFGFNDQEISQVYDHRIVMLVNDAMKYRNMQKAKPGIAKKITKPSKVFSSGVKSDKNDVSLLRKKEKFGRLKKSGSVQDATSIFLDMINNKPQQ